MRPERIIQTVAVAIVIFCAITTAADRVLREEFQIEPVAIVQRLADAVAIKVHVDENSVSLRIGGR